MLGSLYCLFVLPSSPKPDASTCSYFEEKKKRIYFPFSGILESQEQLRWHLFKEPLSRRRKKNGRSFPF
jgi:hypothetical protein